jgi:hypothetical protein
MICNYVLNEYVCQICYYLSFPVRYKPSILGESIYNYYDTVVDFLSDRIGR